jgi:hypothetical protein
MESLFLFSGSSYIGEDWLWLMQLRNIIITHAVYSFWLLIRQDQSTGYAATYFSDTPEMIIPPVSILPLR